MNSSSSSNSSSWSKVKQLNLCKFLSNFVAWNMIGCRGVQYLVKSNMLEI